jgi:NAD(P)-dependent dehydrogenase (short-subunit alcohol dehydrogenase family)
VDTMPSSSRLISRTCLEVARVVDSAGEIDVLVNLAGVAALAPTADTNEAAFDALFQINVKAPFFLVAALAPQIAARGGGSIINISTMVSSYGQPGLSAYGASRAAIELLTKAWAAEYGPHNVRVNAVAPGPTLTPTLEPRLEMAKEFAKQIPLGRVADVHELSDVITFLATRRPATSAARSSTSTGAAPRSKRRRDDPWSPLPATSDTSHGLLAHDPARPQPGQGRRVAGW